MGREAGEGGRGVQDFMTTWPETPHTPREHEPSVEGAAAPEAFWTYLKRIPQPRPMASPLGTSVLPLYLEQAQPLQVLCIW